MADIKKYAMFRAGDMRPNHGEIWMIPQEDEKMAKKMTEALCADGYECVGMLATDLQPVEIRTGFAYQAEQALYRCNECLGRIQGLIHEWA